MFKILTDFGTCFTTNMLTSSMIFTDEIHDDFKQMKTLFSNESEPLWTPEKGYRDENVNYPLRATRADYNFLLKFNEIYKDNVCRTKNSKVFIHKPNEIVTPFHDYNLVFQEEFIEYELTQTSHRTDQALKSFSPEIQKCFFEGEKKLKFFKTYTKALCEWECVANQTLKKCGCAKFSMPRDQKTKICNIFELHCSIDIKPSYCNCLSLCNDVKYIYKIEKAQFGKIQVFSEENE